MSELGACYCQVLLLLPISRVKQNGSYLLIGTRSDTATEQK